MVTTSLKRLIPHEPFELDLNGPESSRGQMRLPSDGLSATNRQKKSQLEDSQATKVSLWQR